MKFFFATLITFLIINSAFAQAPAIEWAKCYGGSNDDFAYCIKSTYNGGYIIVGGTYSNDGDVSYNHGDEDFWVLKLDSVGSIEWQKTYGGSGPDEAVSVEQTTDSGFIVAGLTGSFNGDVAGNHGQYDAWIIRIDKMGNIQWKKCFGGTLEDFAYAVQQTRDGGYIVAGVANSNNGDVSGNHGSADVWIIKLNRYGDLLWQKCFGGTVSEAASSIQQINNGFIISASTKSNDNDVSGLHGTLDDYWILKINDSANIVWQKCLGGSRFDFANSVRQTNDGGFIIGGNTNSHDGDVNGNHDTVGTNEDYWLIKVDSNGIVEWKKCYGGSMQESPYTVQQTSDGGYIAEGWASSYDYDVVGNHFSPLFSSDIWILKTDSDGNIEWQKCIGGTANDGATSLLQISSQEFIVAGFATSDNGDVIGNHGNSDVWVAKLSSNVYINENTGYNLDIVAQFSSNFISLTFSSLQFTNLHLTLTDIIGRTLYQTQLTATTGINKKEIDVGDLAKGIYIVTLRGEEGEESVKVVKE